MIGISPPRCRRKIVLFGPDSHCKRSLALGAGCRLLNTCSYIGHVGSVEVRSSCLGLIQSDLYNIPQAALSSSWILEQHFAKASMVLLCFDYHQRIYLPEALRKIRQYCPTVSIALAFYTPIELPAYDATALTAAENTACVDHAVSTMCFIIRAVDSDFMIEFKEMINRLLP